MYLELGILPARFLIMENFLKYIIRESFFFMIRQVYGTLKKGSIKWDFIGLTRKAMNDLDIDRTEEK